MRFFFPACFDGQEWLGKSQIFCSPKCLYVATHGTSVLPVKITKWKWNSVSIIEDTFESFSPLSIFRKHLLWRYGESNWIDSLSKRNLKNFPLTPATKNIHRYFWGKRLHLRRYLPTAWAPLCLALTKALEFHSICCERNWIDRYP